MTVKILDALDHEREQTANKGVASGYAGLDAGARLLDANLPVDGMRRPDLSLLDVRRDFGAKCDLVMGVDAAITSGLATVTSTVFTGTQDNGKVVAIVGAGSSGIKLFVTTVTTGANGSATLAATAGTTVSGATIYLGTDDTAAFLAALTQWVTNGYYGTVFFPASSMIAGALQQTSTVNAQICLPTVAQGAVKAAFPTLVLMGAVPPSQAQFLIPSSEAHVPGLVGTYLYSPVLGAGVDPAVLAAGQLVGAFNNLCVTVRNLAIRTHFGVNIHAWQLYNAQGMDLEGCLADVAESVAQVTAGSAPTAGYGILPPKNDNEAFALGRNCFARGYFGGHGISEWTDLDHIQVMHCLHGYRIIGPANHTFSAGVLAAQWCALPVVFVGGASSGAIRSLDVEHAAKATAWYYPSGGDISDGSNYGYATINGSGVTTSADSGSGATREILTKDGGANLILQSPFIATSVLGGFVTINPSIPEMTVAGLLAATTAVVAPQLTSSAGLLINTAGNSYDITFGASALIVRNTAVLTAHNTLDDGSGVATFGTTTFSNSGVNAAVNFVNPGAGGSNWSVLFPRTGGIAPGSWVLRDNVNNLDAIIIEQDTPEGGLHLNSAGASFPGNVAIGGALDVDGISASPITSGALPTVTPSSGTAFQCLTTRDVTLVIATTATLVTGTATIALSPDNSTFSTLGVATPGVAASVDLDTIAVPAGWWVKITLSNATVTATYY